MRSESRGCTGVEALHRFHVERAHVAYEQPFWPARLFDPCPPPPTTRYPPFRTFVCLCQHVASFPPHNKHTKKLALILQSVHVLTLSCCPDRGTLYRPPPSLPLPSPSPSCLLLLLCSFVFCFALPFFQTMCCRHI